MRKLMVLIIFCISVSFGMTGMASAININVTETFGTGPTLPQLGIGNLNATSDFSDWSAIYTQSFNDVGYDDTLSNTGLNNGDRYMWLQDDAVIGTRIDTTGFTSITLGFDWRMFLVGSGDELRVGWTTSDSQPTVPGGTTANWNAAFTELGFITNDTTWDPISFNLGAAAENTTDLWIAFFLDDGVFDLGLVDNVLVSGSDYVPDQLVVPEPSTMLLLGIGLVGLVGAKARRRLRKSKS